MRVLTTAWGRGGRRAAALMAVGVAALTAPAASRAQTDAPTPPALPAVRSYRHTLATSPLAIALGSFSAEYERVIGGGISVAVGGSRLAGISLDDDEYGDGDDSRETWAHAKLLYYPDDDAPRGVSFGGTVGYHSSYERNNYPLIGPSSGQGPRTDGGATAGFVADYNRLVGPSRRILVGVGLGARLVLKDVDEESPLAPGYWDGRLVVGLAF